MIQSEELLDNGRVHECQHTHGQYEKQTEHEHNVEFGKGRLHLGAAHLDLGAIKETGVLH